MPRQPRLDAPGLLQHVIARGIERTKIFRDDKDRKSFLERFADVLEAAQTQCYAWALIPNHFHALLRTGATPLSKVMRRLMTGYAVTFNKRHKRSGHLFQNRYKSIVCEEDPYLLELLRYIHVNPLRAGLVKDLKGLDNHPWTGHSVLLGKRKNPLIPKPPDQARNKSAIRNPCPVKREACLTGAQSEMSLAERTTQDVLLHFGDSVKIARREYREFVEKGIDQGRRPELQGGGLVRSAGGDKRGLLGRKKEEREKGDERILGSGDFVADALQKAGKSFEAKQSRRPPLKALIDIVSEAFGVSAKQLKSGSRRRAMVQARSVVAYVAVRRYGYKGFEVAEALASSSPSVSRNIEKGEFILDNNKELKIEFPVT